MSGLLDGRVAIVTGAGQGVGEGIAQALAGAGAAVVIAARRAENGEPAVATIRDRGHEASFVRCDVTVEADVVAAVDHAVAEHGRLDIVVHNAVSPPGPPAPVQDVDPDIITDADPTAFVGVTYAGQADRVMFDRRTYSRVPPTHIWC